MYVVLSPIKQNFNAFSSFYYVCSSTLYIILSVCLSVIKKTNTLLLEKCDFLNCFFLDWQLKFLVTIPNIYMDLLYIFFIRLSVGYAWKEKTLLFQFKKSSVFMKTIVFRSVLEATCFQVMDIFQVWFFWSNNIFSGREGTLDC